jgi:chromosomal replication initiation ATPase DnaA
MITCVNEPTHSAGPRVQLRLPLEREPAFERELFVVSDSNREAVALIDAWPAWPGGAVAIVGPGGSGKTHLARAWAKRTGAILMDPGAAEPGLASGRPVLLNDAAQRIDDATLFHLINNAATGSHLLLTTRTAPRTWPVTLPDLRSRLNAMVTADLGPPDDTVLKGVLTRFFKDRHIRPDEELLVYLLRRMERSVPAARALVVRLDAIASDSGREVNRTLAREVLKGFA